MKILHLQIPFRNKKTQDNFAVSPKTLGQFMKYYQEKLGEEYLVMASPCIPSLLSDSDVLLNFDMKGISLRELKELILPIDKNDTL
jgi:hypothetical protein